MDAVNWTLGEEVEQVAPAPSEAEMELVQEIKDNYLEAEEWESQARLYFDYDYKFSNGDTHNKYQWDSDLVTSREEAERPVLTVNKTQVHNLLVINDAKQNKPGVRIRPVGDKASYDGAQIFQELVYHIEYISNAESVYDNATSYQVQAGWGYWRIITDYISENTFDQEIYIRRIKDPRAVYLDKYINEVDGSDARYGIIFEDMPKELFKKEHPKFAYLAGMSTLGDGSQYDGWFSKDNVRVAEYYKKIEKEDKLVTWINPNTQEQVLKHKSKFTDQEKLVYQAISKEKASHEMWAFRQRDVILNNVMWYKIAGNRIIDEKPWLGKYIPIVRLIGTETVIDGILDRKGHTRALINPQQIYNYNTSASVEYGALQTKSPWLAPADAISGYEEYYKTANTYNHSYLPYNHMGEDGQAIPAPTRPAAPQASEAYVKQMQIAQNEMMMATGQYQSQMGENENAKSGVAINARQRQGDKATYHFIDNQAIAIRFTGKILIDLIPKVYDTKRVMQIQATDGSILNVTIDPEAEQEYQKIDNPNAPMVNGQKIIEVIFNPNFGYYDIQSDTGPSFATKRMDAANALTQIAANDKDFLKIGGDVMFDMMDFPKADVLAQRFRKMLPPELKDEGADPQVEQLMEQASQMIEMLQGKIGELEQELKNKDKELLLKAGDLDLKTNREGAIQEREDYRAETDRLVALGNAGPGVSVEQIQPIIKQLLQGMIQNGELNMHDLPGPHEGGTVAQIPSGEEGEGGGEMTPPEPPGEEEPPVEGARKAPDGRWYVKQGNGYAMVEMA